MVDLHQLIEECDNKSDVLYLLCPLSKSMGFFVLNKQVLFVTKHTGNEDVTSFDTEKLQLNLSVNIKAVANMPTFSSGFYDYILFKSEEEENDFNVFVDLCTLYSKDTQGITLKQFFYSLLSLFQAPKEQSFKNLLGLFGELSVIYDFYNKSGKLLSKGWHRNSNDKYDFVLDDFILEVKSTAAADGLVTIKYDQLFSRPDIILGVVLLEETNAGCTLMDLINKINHIKEFEDDIVFQLALANEEKKVSPDEAHTRKLELRDISYYYNHDVPTFNYIPAGISSVEYKCCLDGIDSVSVQSIV